MSELETQKVPLRLVVWGESQDDVDAAVHHAGLGSWRADWEFVQIHPVVGGACPIDLMDGTTVATGSGKRWAYAVYPMPRPADG